MNGRGMGRHQHRYTGSLSDKLMEVDLSVITNKICDTSSGDTYSMLCAMDFGKDLCQGDSGGPLMLKSSQGADV